MRIRIKFLPPRHTPVQSPHNSTGPSRRRRAPPPCSSPSHATVVGPFRQKLSYTFPPSREPRPPASSTVLSPRDPEPVARTTTTPLSFRLPAFVSFDDTSAIKKVVEDAMPIATGHEHEELQAELEEAPAVVKSFYDKRIVGCPGGEGEDEQDVVWFWLEKGKPHECPVCAQYFLVS